MLKNGITIALRKIRLNSHFHFMGCFKPTSSIGTIKLLRHNEAPHLHNRTGEQKGQPLPHNQNEWAKNVLGQVLAQYPFARLPSVGLQRVMKLNMQEQVRQVMVAWWCLQCHNKEQLERAYLYLLPEKHHLQFIQKKINYNGEAIFSDYFQKHLSTMIEKINSTTVNSKEKLAYLNTLVHMRSSQSLKKHIRLIKRKTLQQLNQNLLVAIMINLKARNNMPYADYLALLEQQFRNSNQEGEIPSIRVAYFLAMVPYFHRYYPRIIIKAIFIIFRSHLKQLNNRDILRVLKKIYQNNSKYARLLAEDLVQLIKKTNPLKDNSREKNLLPLVFKVIDYCSVLDVSPEELIHSIIGRITQFGPAIAQEGLTQQLFIIKLYKRFRKDLPSESLTNLEAFIVGRLEQFETARQIIEQEFVGIAQLLYKFRGQLSKTSGVQCALKILQVLSTIQQFNPSVWYQCLNSVLSLKYIFKQSGYTLTAEQLEQLKIFLGEYFKKSCQKVVGGLLIVKNVNETINLVAKMGLNHVVLPVEDCPNVCNLKFKELRQYSMDIETLQNLVSYLAYCKLDNHFQLLKVLPQLENIIFSFFNNQKVTFRTTLDILQVASACNYYNSNLYNKIQKAIFQIVQKYPEFKISPRQLGLIREYMGQKGLGNPTFNKFIENSIDNFQKWQQHRQEYIKKEGAFYKWKQQKQSSKDLFYQLQ